MMQERPKYGETLIIGTPLSQSLTKKKRYARPWRVHVINRNMTIRSSRRCAYRLWWRTRIMEAEG